MTPNGRSILSGRARTLLGGGGSINYTMMHESSEWLVKQAGHDVAYYNYESLFTETLIEQTTDDQSDEGVTEKSVVGIDFFSGDVLRLVYLISSLYMCFLPFNGFKRLMGRYPIIFTYLSNAIRMLLTAIISLIVVLGRILPFLPTSIKVTTALIKFNASKEGYYERVGNKIILRFFDDDRDYAIAEEAINENIAFLESSGVKPPFIIRFLLQFLTKTPYKRGRQVKRYVKHFAEKTLLSEQHFSGRMFAWRCGRQRVGR